MPECSFKVIHNILVLDQNLSNRVLKQLSDGASTTKDGIEFHKLTTLVVKNTFSYITHENIFSVTYT